MFLLSPLFYKRSNILQGPLNGQGWLRENSQLEKLQTREVLLLVLQIFLVYDIGRVSNSPEQFLHPYQYLMFKL